MRTIARRTDHGVEAFDAAMRLVHSFPIPQRASNEQPWDQTYAVAPTLDRVVLTTDDTAFCLDREGREQWRFRPESGPPEIGRPLIGCVYSGDGALVWLYLPDVEAGRGDADRWIALDAATGGPRIEHRLETTGQGGRQLATPDGQYVLLDVDQGQIGCEIYRAGPRAELHRYPWDDRSLVALSSDARQFMTVGHGRENLSFHDFPSGEVRATLRVENFGEDPLVASIEWSGGYLDDNTAIAVLSREGTDEEVWWRHYTVDTRTGAVTGQLNVITMDPNDLKPLGDGTYLVTDADGTLRRL